MKFYHAQREALLQFIIQNSKFKIASCHIKPDAGRIEMHGRIGALIALGAGFNPILNACGNRQIPALIFTS